MRSTRHRRNRFRGIATFLFATNFGSDRAPAYWKSGSGEGNAGHLFLGRREKTSAPFKVFRATERLSTFDGPFSRVFIDDNVGLPVTSARNSGERHRSLY